MAPTPHAHQGTAADNEMGELNKPGVTISTSHAAIRLLKDITMADYHADADYEANQTNERLQQKVENLRRGCAVPVPPENRQTS